MEQNTTNTTDTMSILKDKLASKVLQINYLAVKKIESLEEENMTGLSIYANCKEITAICKQYLDELFN